MSDDNSKTLVGEGAGQYAAGGHMTAIGSRAGLTARDKTLVAVGFDAAKYNSGDHVTVVGYASASHNSGSETITIGLNSNKFGVGDWNIAIGNNSLSTFIEDEEKIATIEDERTFRVPDHGYEPGKQYLFHLSSTGLLPRYNDQELRRAPLRVLDQDRLTLLSTSISFRGERELRIRRVINSVRNNIVIGHGLPASEDDLIQIGTAAHKRFYTPPPVETDGHFRNKPHLRATLPPPHIAKEGAFLYCRDARGEGLPGLVYCDGERWFRADTHEPL